MGLGAALVPGPWPVALTLPIIRDFPFIGPLRPGPGVYSPGHRLTHRELPRPLPVFFFYYLVLSLRYLLRAHVARSFHEHRVQNQAHRVPGLGKVVVWGASDAGSSHWWCPRDASLCEAPPEDPARERAGETARPWAGNTRASPHRRPQTVPRALQAGARPSPSSLREAHRAAGSAPGHRADVWGCKAVVC